VRLGAIAFETAVPQPEVLLVAEPEALVSGGVYCVHRVLPAEAPPVYCSRDHKGLIAGVENRLNVSARELNDYIGSPVPISITHDSVGGHDGPYDTVDGEVRDLDLPGNELWREGDVDHQVLAVAPQIQRLRLYIDGDLDRIRTRNLADSVKKRVGYIISVVGEEDLAVAALCETLEGKGRCRISTGQYRLDGARVRLICRP
jgi:hypothetical protein